MATIGLDKLYYATITENPDTGEETYAKPKPLAKAISAELSIEVAEAILYADDGPSEIVKEFKSGTLTETLATKADSITFSTSSVEGTILRRNKPDSKGWHPWKAEVTESATGVKPETITNWYAQVYEPAATSED